MQIFAVMFAIVHYCYSYTQEGAIEWFVQASMNETLVNDVSFGFYRFNSSSRNILHWTHNLILGELNVNKSCYEYSHSANCISMENLTYVKNKKSIKHEVVAYTPFIFMQEVFWLLIPIMISSMYFYLISPRFGTLRLWFPDQCQNLEKKWCFHYPLVK